MDTSSRTAQLCIAGTRAEFLRLIDDARRLYREAWDAAQDSYEAAMAAHYVAHLESDQNEALKWHRTALEQATRDSRGEEFMGSLMVSLGGAYEAVGQFEEADRWYELAAECGCHHAGESPRRCGMQRQVVPEANPPPESSSSSPPH